MLCRNCFTAFLDLAYAMIPLWQRGCFLVNCFALRCRLASARSSVANTFRCRTQSPEMARITTIALDIEGTLISNAVSQFPRPGLFGFLQFCRDTFHHIYIYTAVRDEKCIPIVRTLVDDGFAPAWFAEIPFVQWDRSVKNLDHVPGCSTSECLLLDDNRDYVVDSQLDQWIEIEKFQSPYPDTDSELQRVQSAIAERLS